jgi:hypothetical protein
MEARILKDLVGSGDNGIGVGTKIPNTDSTARVMFCQGKRRNFYTEGAEVAEKRS